MRKITLLALTLIGFSLETSAQCSPEIFTAACVPQLTTGFNFLKSYKIDGENGAKEKVDFHTIVF